MLPSVTAGLSILVSLVALHVDATPVPSNAKSNVNPLAKRHSSGLPFTDRSIPLNGRVPRDAVTSARRNKHLGRRWYGTDVTLSGWQGGLLYTMPVTIGNQNFTLQIDTGSADLWVHSKNVSCPAAASQTTGIEGGDTGESTSNVTTCLFQNPGYDSSASPTFHELPYAANYNQSFSGGKASGGAGLDDVTVGGITVKQQEFAIADVAAIAFGHGGGSDGIFGLTFPEIGRIYRGADGSNDSTENVVPYNPWFWNAVNQSLIEPYFTVILDKTSFEQQSTGANISNFGTISFGGVPHDAPWSDTSVTVPNVDIPAGNKTVNYWAVAVDSYNFPGSESIPAANNTTPYSLLDSGTFICQVPPLVADAYSKAATPPGQLLNETTYIVKCDANLPDFGITIGGVNFTAPGKNFISPGGGSGVPEGWCYSGVQLSLGGSLDTAIIGDNFLWEVISINDLAKNEVTVIQRSD